MVTSAQTSRDLWPLFGHYCKGVLGKNPVVLCGLYKIIFYFMAARVPSGYLDLIFILSFL